MKYVKVYSTSEHLSQKEADIPDSVITEFIDYRLLLIKQEKRRLRNYHKSKKKKEEKLRKLGIFLA